MASTKSEKENDLTASISKTMTIDKLKTELTKNKIAYSTAKKKVDFVDLYISNGLHNKGTESITISSRAVKPKEELIFSLMISSHGTESYEWPPTMPVAQYYKNNVRVYSRSCVPGLATIRNRRRVRKSVDDAFTIFQQNPESSTQQIMEEYRGIDKAYYTHFLESLTGCNFDIKHQIENKDRCGGLMTYLSQKKFSFEEPASKQEKYKITGDFDEFTESRGINVSDIRLKITDADGSVRYRQIFNPENEFKKTWGNSDMDEDIFDITQFNLIYRHGIEFILKDVLHKEELIGPALRIFDFKEGENKKSQINLEQLYSFFELVGIKYVNIIDHSCRSFHPPFKLTEKQKETLFKKEQQYSVKPVAFGKLKKRSHSKKLLNSKKRRHHKNKYSRKK
jgi:hypothetical protein